MRSSTLSSRVSLALAAVALSALSACASMGNMPMMQTGVTLSGGQEVPPVSSNASGTATIAIAADGAVSGSIKTTDIMGTMAHIHMAAMGANGPVIVPLVKTDDSTWSVPAGAKLTAEQMAAFKAGDLYVNVHSAAHKGGEVRAQLKP